MSNFAIQVEHLSKAYQIGQIGTGTISRDLERWYARIRGKEDPYLRVGENNNRGGKVNSNTVWSLKDINFKISEGNAVGIIGKNGAGKSTLLKILSKVTGPTTGRIMGKGRISSLLEVGTGFHGELSGRENVFLNGAILGMRKKEIERKFEEIVDFAGIERYIDTPVKRYSSGMYVRLAFAVAAHLESEILIVDEVLAVGDAEFQSKCLGKMKEVSNSQGRTVLFVSHNMESVKRLCKSGILLDKGMLKAFGNINDVAKIYTNEHLNASAHSYNFSDSIKTPTDVEPLFFCVKDKNGSLLEEITPYEGFDIVFKLSAKRNIENFTCAIGISTILNFPVRTLWSKPVDIIQGLYEVTFQLDHVFLESGLYNITLGLSSNESTFLYMDSFTTIKIGNNSSERKPSNVLRLSGCGVVLNAETIIDSKL